MKTEENFSSISTEPVEVNKSQIIRMERYQKELIVFLNTEAKSQTDKNRIMNEIKKLRRFMIELEYKVQNIGL
jgi:hypothetical protein